METENQSSNWFHEIHSTTESAELAAQFTNDYLWTSAKEIVTGTKAFLALHGKSYFSPLRASFLFEHASTTSLKHFSPLLVRDGALNILHFFYNNKVNKDIKLLLPEKLKFLIPTSWLPQCFSYKLVQPKNENRKISKILFIVSAFGEKHCSSEQISTFFHSQLQAFANNRVEVYFTYIIPNLPDSFESINRFSSQALDQLFALKNVMGADVKAVSLDDLLKRNLHEWAFLDLNPSSFYYHDSYVHQRLMSQGALNLEAVDSSSENRIFLSPFHSLQIESLDLSHLQKSSHHIEASLEKFKSDPSCAHEENTHRPEKILFETKICSRSFEDFSYEMVHEKLMRKI